MSLLNKAIQAPTGVEPWSSPLLGSKPVSHQNGVLDGQEEALRCESGQASGPLQLWYGNKMGYHFT